MGIGKFSCDSAVDVAADNHHAGYKDRRRSGKDVDQNLGIGNASSCLYR